MRARNDRAASYFPLYMVGGAVIILTGYFALVSSVVDRTSATRVFAPLAETAVIDRARVGL